ncbi:MAG TPA: efflux RND transporter periplasmic adaptor subunit [Phycisphaerae bacterium]|nr:efflux RND transporter periplasmic adaptor subunit [Phycisphaerae bacterium]
MKRRLIVLAIIAAIIAGVVYYTRISKPTEIVLTGIVTTEDVIVSAQVQGRLTDLSVQEGDHVEPGQRIAAIDPRQWQADAAYYTHSQQAAATQVSEAQANLQYQELQTKNQVAQAEANLAAAQAAVVQGNADLENDQLSFEREKVAYGQHVESQQAYDQARTQLAAQQAHVDALKKQVDAAQAAVELARSNESQIASRRALLEMDQHQLAATAAQAQKAQVQLDYTHVTAPVSGIVDVRAARQGEVVQPGQAIVTLINPDDLWVRADVEETYIDRIKIGDKMEVRLPSGATREGTVFYRAVDADYATQRDVSRTKRDIKTFEIRLRCDNSDRALAVGMTAYVLLPLQDSLPDSTPPTSQP